MNKAELVTSISEKSGLTKKDSALALNALMGSIQDALAGGDKVKLLGFGTLKVRDVKARVGTDPRNQEKINIPATKRVSFKASPILKDMVK